MRFRRDGGGAVAGRAGDQFVLEIFLHDRLARRLDGGAGAVGAAHRAAAAEPVDLGADAVADCSRGGLRWPCRDGSDQARLPGEPPHSDRRFAAGRARQFPARRRRVLSLRRCVEVHVRQSRLRRPMLEEAHVAATPGIDFDPVHGRQFVRFSYARSADEMREAVARITRWLRERLGYAAHGEVQNRFVAARLSAVAKATPVLSSPIRSAHAEKNAARFCRAFLLGACLGAVFRARRDHRHRPRGWDSPLRRPAPRWVRPATSAAALRGWVSVPPLSSADTRPRPGSAGCFGWLAPKKAVVRDVLAGGRLRAGRSSVPIVVSGAFFAVDRRRAAALSASWGRLPQPLRHGVGRRRRTPAERLVEIVGQWAAASGSVAGS